MNLRSLTATIIVVFVLSIWWGYSSSMGPFRALIFYEEGLAPIEVAQRLFHQSILHMITGLGGSFLLLLASYYAGKGYKITGPSAVLLLVFLLAAIVTGNFIGYVIRQNEYPQYPILNVNFIVDTAGIMGSLPVWVFLGVLAGNYKRELENRG